MVNFGDNHNFLKKKKKKKKKKNVVNDRKITPKAVAKTEIHGLQAIGSGKRLAQSGITTCKINR